MRRLVPALAAAVVLAASPSAAPAAASVSASATAIALGARIFGPVACGTPVVVPGTFASPDLVAGSDPVTCEIFLNRRYLPVMPRVMRCTLVLHEYGHLAGRPHSSDPDSVMYPVYVAPDERCVAALSRAVGAWGTSGSAPPTA